ncbi:NAD-binding protein [Robbsia sp. KACC 23696]|uniref:NAD-binding protein n=1 Tax=Robbsia sp. KACC 23696 TaxID=3149231 RepID=UPI00325A8C07
MHFFLDILDGMCDGGAKVLLVTHAVPGVSEYVTAMVRRDRLIGVIPKPNTADKRTLQQLASLTAVFNVSRSDIDNRSTRYLDLLAHLDAAGKFVIVDMGGYFADAVSHFPEKIQRNLIGIVEDTENGHQRYERTFARLPAAPMGLSKPVVSVARSALKEPEDFLVGQAVVFSADAALRRQNVILPAMKTVVFGYGKVGSSIAQCLKQRGAIVFVCERDPAREALALAHGFQVFPKDDALRRAELIFCATGNHCIGMQDFDRTSSRKYVFCATSGDDELEDFDAIKRVMDPTGIWGIVQTPCRGTVSICNHGHSVNFLHNGSLGPYVKLVQAELLVAASRVDRFLPGEISELDRSSRASISKVWLKHHMNAVN